MLSNKLRTKPKLNKLEGSHQISFNFDAIGTKWLIIIEQDLDQYVFEQLKSAVFNRIEVFDQNYSRFRTDSLITKISKNKGSFILPDDAKPMFDLYEKLYELSEGLVTPLIGQLLSDAGYDSDYSLSPSKLRMVPDWKEVMLYNYPYLITEKALLIDVGAAGKGYLIDIIAKIIEDHGISHFSINAGGDIINHDVSYQLSRIGMEHPTCLNQAIGVAKISNGSICGSAGNRRSWANFNHIMNPLTKRSPDHILATWVVADTTLIADGLSTALYFSEIPKLKQYYQFEYALISNNLSLEHSDNFPADFFFEER